MPTINGWTVLAHPFFLGQWEKLVEAVDELKAKKPDDYQKTADAKVLASLVQLVTVNVPSDPTASIYRQGATLGDDRKHWFRAKFGNGRFRLFFRYSSTSKVIIFAWVTTKTACEPMAPKRMPTRSSKGCWMTAIRPTVGTRSTRRLPIPRPLHGWKKLLPRIHDGWC